MSRVKVVAHPETGNVITPSTRTPGFGTIRVDSESVSMENGFVNKSKRTAFIRGRISDLESLGFEAGNSLPGRIVKKESFEPFYDEQAPKAYPDSHPNAGESVLTNGQETYLQYEYTANVQTPDSWVGGNIEEASQEAQEALAEQAV